ncbi:uncharacterized protein Tco025E_08193 [Trypanosoma conorhini]|uniref:Ribosome biogenesis protein SLX9 n=1 Tax=Trypanosoma conorhini TaxID=83891 RepID=A0A3R7MJA9_9TRYP|nr:uncharacterized protein Tco025E_08193 [Trypanosoma conorhini]RNF03517.1 uncharacterized protein Tco025E_08193 [Trypanosoma conorhini]
MVKSSSRVQRRLVERAAAVPASPAGQPHADGAARHGGPRGRSVGGADGTAGARASPVEAVRETRRRESRLRRKATKKGQRLSAKAGASGTGRGARGGARGGQLGGAGRTTTTIVHDERRAARRFAGGTGRKAPGGGGGRKEEQRRQLAAKLVAGEQHPSRKTAAEARMATAKAELALFDQVLQAPAFVADPFSAIEGHLSGAMACLQPQTPDVGRRRAEE